MSDLIVDSKDGRLAIGNRELLPSVDDGPIVVDRTWLLIHSLQLALGRAEAAEQYAERLRGAVSGASNLDYIIALEKRVKELEDEVKGIGE